MTGPTKKTENGNGKKKKPVPVDPAKGFFKELKESPGWGRKK